MKRILLMGAALLFTHQAHAVDVVTDPGLWALTQLGIADDAAHWASQAASMTAQVAKATATLQQIQTLYSMMNNPVALIGYGATLLTGNSQSPLGTDIAATIKLASGVGRLAGTANSLAGQVQDTNSFYLPPLNGTFVASMMVNRSNQNAAIDGMLRGIMNTLPDRLVGLQELQMAVNAGGNVNYMASLNARISSESAIAQQQAQQAQLLIGMAAVQKATEEGQWAQRSSLEALQFAASRAAASGGLVNGGYQPTTVAATSSNNSPNFPGTP